MWFEERSWSNLKMSSLIVEEWRDLWSLKIDVIVASLAYVFATTNFLNLPRLILENGGLAFVAAYGASILACVLPIIIMELSVGQLTGRAPVQAFYNICPIFKGVGMSQIIFSLFVMAHMARYLGWLMLYLFYLFWAVLAGRPGLPWLNCKNFPELQTIPCREAGSLANFTHEATTKLTTISAQSSLVQFMNALERPSGSIAEIGQFQIHILVAIGAVWISVFIAICFGVRWLGKVTHFTFISPLVLLSLLLVRALTLNGLVAILQKYYHATDWQRMTDYMMWKTAAEQAILATGIGFGAYITIGSYNKRSNNLVGDTFIILFGHAILTLMQVLTIIGFVGHISSRTGLQPIELLDKGEAQMWHILAYMSYVPDTRIWTGIVLFMCIFVLLNVFYLLSLNVLAALEDAFGEKWSKCFPRFSLALFVCLLGYSIGLYFTTQGGVYAYELTGGYLKYVTLWAILCFELLAVGWFYCAHRLGKDLHTMLSRACCWCFGHFLLFFTYLLPVIPIAIAAFNMMSYNYSIYSSGVHEWKYSELVGWAIALIPLMPIPLVMQFTICRICIKGPGVTKWQKFKNTISSPLHYEVVKSSPTNMPRYASTAPGYVLLPQAPLAEPETYNDSRN
ncbi:Sodium- and chloride-dependent GABA transporter ine [Toxocara canis]|uniref:Sodium-and chloride-dependent GABA transporter ine n=1 Tax=Toxocara canis TaxID=6265 RepID=A0A0B2VT91_TOXCA|nr:Sodium- and chloride-dependent GABA transporter ine [Toxocara canis]